MTLPVFLSLSFICQNKLSGVEQDRQIRDREHFLCFGLKRSCFISSGQNSLQHYVFRVPLPQKIETFYGMA